MKLVFATLADPAGFLPMPDLGGRAFPAEGFLIDADNAFWMSCLKDGSIVEGQAPKLEPERAAAVTSETRKKDS